ncbi:MAG: PAS domain-containing protein [Chloroflexales bacterium]|nr:PAS domain-containing protein [Chloroflexales bacterium]
MAIMQPNTRQGLFSTDDSQLRQIVAANADGILVVDGDGVVRFLNPAAASILGRHSEDLIGQNFGYPVLRTERAEIDLHHPDGAHQIAEMRVVDTEWEGGPAQLISLRDITEHRRAQQALRDAESFNWAILNALTVHLAVLDATGTIVAINDAWREFARKNGDPEMRYTGLGINYFTVCQHASGPWADEASPVLSGMQAVLSGKLPLFEMEYPCHSPEEERWFILRVVPLKGERPGLLIAHTNVTDQRRMARATAEAEALRERLRAREREMRDVDRISVGDAAHLRRSPSAPLRQRAPTAFSQGVERYRTLLDEALQHRAKQTPLPAAGLRDLGERLGTYEATPRDVVELHIAAVRAAGADAPPPRQQAYLEEGRLLVLELMGNLATHYRNKAVGRSGEPDDTTSGQI